LNELGRVDIDRMASLIGKSKLEVIRDLQGRIYNDPQDGWVQSDVYLSGNVKRKLAEAIEAANENEDLRENVAALEKVQPEDIESIDISVRMGAPWLPVEEMSAFVEHLTGQESDFLYTAAIANWTSNISTFSGDQGKRRTWGTDRIPFERLMQKILNSRPIVVKNKDADGNKVVNTEATAEANAKADELREAFADWIWRDSARRERLGRMYNDRYNNRVQRQYDGSHLTFPGKVENATKLPNGDTVGISLRPHQNDLAWRLIQEGTVLADHTVGAGKTYAAIAGVMEMRRLGLAKKPMVTVPNHLVEQWAEDFMRLYPQAKVMIPTKADFKKDKRRELFAKIATGDWDAVVVAHSSFGFIPLPLDEQTLFLEEQIKDLREAVDEMKAANASGRDVKAAEKLRDRFKEQLERAADAKKKDDTVDWKQLGVDMVVVDEAHEYKNLYFTTKKGRLAGLSTSFSQKATDLFMKTRSIQRANNGRNVMFLTGTPISNTIAEMYTMQRYMDYETLKSMNLTHFDAWADTFGKVTTEWELDSTSQGYKLQSRFSEFENVPELLKLYGKFTDSVPLSQLQEDYKARGSRWPIPKMKGGKAENVVVPRSDAMAAYMEHIVHRAENLPTGPPQKGDDNMLTITNDAVQSALELRLKVPGAPDHPSSKVNESIKRIRTLYDKWHKDKGTQLVFIDRNRPKGTAAKEKAAFDALVEKAKQGELAAITKLENMDPDTVVALSQQGISVYDDMKSKLIATGIPEDQIAFIHDAHTDKQKALQFDRVNSGKIRILIGSTQKMGVGMNVQERLVGLHSLNAPWRPADLEQREGRILRQGNELYARDPDGFEIEILRYATERTYDARMWQTLETKALFIEQVRRQDDKTRTVGDVAKESANAADMKAAASGNPLIMEQVKLAGAVKKLALLEKSFNRRKYGDEDQVRQWEALGKTVEELHDEIRAKVKHWTDARDANPGVTDKKKNKIYTATVKGERTVGLKPVASAVNGAVVRIIAYDRKDVPIPILENYRGVEITGELNSYGFGVRADWLALTIHAKLPNGDFKRVTKYDVDMSKKEIKEFSGVGLLQRIDNFYEAVDRNAQFDMEQWTARAQEVEGARERLSKPFPKAEEMEQKKKRLAEVIALLTAAQEGAQADPVQTLLDNDIVRGVMDTMDIESAKGKRLSEEDGAAIVKAFEAANPETGVDQETGGRKLIVTTPDQFITLVVNPENKLYSVYSGRNIFGDSETDVAPEQRRSSVERTRDKALPDTRGGRAKLRDKFSRGETTGPGATQPQFESAVKREFGPRAMGMMAVSFVDKPSDLGGRRAADTLAITRPDGSVAFVLGNIPEHGAVPVFVHEAVHAVVWPELEQQGVLGKIVTDLQRLRKTNKAVQRAYAQIPKKADKAHHDEEAMAYLVQNNPRMTIVQRLINAVKRALRAMGIKGKWVEDNADEIRQTVIDTIKRRASGRPGEQRGNLPEPELDDAAKEARGQIDDNRNKIVEAIKKGQPLDRIFRLPFQMMGAVDSHGRWKRGTKTYERLTKLVTETKFDDESYAGSHINPILEKARASLIDRYGLTDEYKKLDNRRKLHETLKLREGQEVLKKLIDHGVDLREAQVLQSVLTGERIAGPAWESISEPIRRSIAEMGQEAVMLGLISQEAYDRNAGAYLHRSYLKYEGDQPGLVRMMNNMLTKRRKAIVGNELKARGIDLPVNLKRLPGELAEGDKVIQYRNPDTRRRVYRKPGESAPEGYEQTGEWTVRSTNKKKGFLWRDYTKEERERMGEILDARYNIAKTYQLLASDLATGKFLKSIAENDNWARVDEPEGTVGAAREGISRTFSDVEWIKVPDSKIPKSQAKRWGALAGMYVRSEIWRDLNQLDEMQHSGTWSKLLTQWKLNKTARNPVVHMNNVMSNFLLADMADIRFRDIARALSSFKVKDQDYQDAEVHGVFGNTFLHADIRRNVLDPILQEIKGQASNDDSIVGAVGLMGKITTRTWNWLKKVDNKLLDTYQAEDELFRLATYLHRKELGDSSEEAAALARSQFIDYDIRAPGINALRQSVLPFLSYTYRAVPVVAKAIAERPWKLAKYTTIAYAANMLAYMLSGGDEEEDRRTMREEVQGDTWVGTYRMMRMPYRDRNGDPGFLDVRRWIPVGDIQDMNQNELPIPAPFQFGGPIMIAGELMLNKAAFTKQEIFNKDADTPGEITGKVATHLYRSWMPSAPWIPNSWYWNKIDRAMTGGRDSLMREYSVPQALLSSVGVKVTSHNAALGEEMRLRDISRTMGDIKWALRRLQKDRARGLIDEDEFAKAYKRKLKKVEKLEAAARKVTGQDSE